LEKIMKIDVHAHADLNGGREIPRFNGDRFATPEELRVMYKRLGIDRGVLLPLVNPEFFAVQSNEQAYMATQNHPDLLFWFCSLDPRMAYNSPKTNFSYFIEHYKKLGAKGVGELLPNVPTDGELMDNLFYHCAECDMPVTIDISPDDREYGYYGIQDSLGLPRLERMLKKHKKLKIIGHSPMFWSLISGDVTKETMHSYPPGKITPGGPLFRLMREYEFLYADLSAGSGGNAMMRDTEASCKFIEEFQDKLMFGTDICSPNDDLPLSFWLDDVAEKGLISETAYKKVCRLNAIRILRLDNIT